MNKGLIGGGITVIIGVMVVMMMFPSLLGSIGNMQVDDGTRVVNSTTGVGETTEDVAFADPLYEDNIVNVTSITSDNGADTPVASTYTSATDTLTVSGLAASGTRVISIAYQADALDGYTGLSDMVSMSAFIIFAAIVLAAFAGLYYSSKGRV